MQAEEILRRLVARPTVVGQPNGTLLEDVRAYLAQHGIEATLLPSPDQGRSSLFASIGPSDRRGYLLSAHVDVVPAQEPDWQADPFTLRQEKDRLIGRGAVDMKGFLAAVLSTMPDLVAQDRATPLHLALSYDEEAGCRGVPHLVAALPGLCPPPLGCFVGEPTGMRPVLRHKGKATLRLSAAGRSGHSARPDLGENAIHRLLPVLSEAAALAQALTAGPQHPAFTPPTATAQIGTLSGGTAVNIIPEAASALVELRALPAEDPEALLAPILACAAQQGVTAEIIAAYPGLDQDPDSEITLLACQLSGAAPQGAVSFGTEAGVYQRAGIPAIVCGPGDMARAHRPEEYITQGELAQARRFVLDLAQAVG